jgi:hypothetical protein
VSPTNADGDHRVGHHDPVVAGPPMYRMGVDSMSSWELTFSFCFFVSVGQRENRGCQTELQFRQSILPLQSVSPAFFPGSDLRRCIGVGS